MSDLQDVRKYSSEQFDKSLTLLASGGLVVTIGFVEKILKITQETNLVLLKLTWILFASTLLLNLFSHLSSSLSIDLELKKRNKSSSFFNGTTLVLNILSIIAVMTAIVLFIVFVSKNLKNG
jgi:hypothetical protein